MTVARSYLDKTGKKEIGRYRLNQNSVMDSSSVDQSVRMPPGFEEHYHEELGSQLSVDRNDPPTLAQKI